MGILRKVVESKLVIPYYKHDQEIKVLAMFKQIIIDADDDVESGSHTITGNGHHNHGPNCNHSHSHFHSHSHSPNDKKFESESERLITPKNQCCSNEH